jgi:hypothetical protein
LRNDLIGEHLGVEADDVVKAAGQHEGSLIAAIEALRRLRSELHGVSMRTLLPYQTPKLADLSQWLADNEIEPHRVCRRPFRLSYAAMAGSSSMA